ncbi:hypothetical protein WM40_12700 [Robbsia andropogonis]|uniref:citrate synthase (unknown stereospecificity) n=1 Tax=Robbsia andropogonis TaxID=28092 RepID=A0A0F5K082_9BURK|nr:citrate synthase family protein [Robbsia andropogonis]KKB63340.1 hypothetical protein WM40_12700 [Robbsia andropogonis]
MKEFLSSDEASALLQISLPTLYAYVSRGLIRSIQGEERRARSYFAEDVYRLISTRTARQTSNKSRGSSDVFGVPIESRIALIDKGMLWYRGRSAITLAQTSTIEEVASMLWEVSKFDQGSASDNDIFRLALERIRHAGDDASPLHRALIGLGFAASTHGHFWLRDDRATAAAGAFVLKMMLACVTGVAPTSEPIHQQLARAWKIDDPNAVNVLRAALILCVDHELNPSTYTVRCIASTGSNVLLAVMGGLGALFGPRHGGATGNARTLIREALRESDIPTYLVGRLNGGEQFASFGHKLYPDGDPRATCLLALLRSCRDESARLSGIQEIANTIHRAINLRPNLDFALAAIEETLALPVTSALTLFGIGRAVGWIAHAKEQAMIKEPIRPRAIYIGPRPVD